MIELEHPALIWVYGAALVAFVWACLSILRRTAARRATTQASAVEGEHEHEYATTTSLVPPERGTKMCRACKVLPATHRLPEIGVSIFERMNPLRALYGGSHLYRRVESAFGPLVVCATHAEFYGSLMDEQLADLRQMATRLATEMDRRVSHLRSGALLIAVTQEHQEAARQLAKSAISAASQAHLPALLGSAPVQAPRIVEATPDDVAISAQQTTNGKTGSAAEAN